MVAPDRAPRVAPWLGFTLFALLLAVCPVYAEGAQHDQTEKECKVVSGSMVGGRADGGSMVSALPAPTSVSIEPVPVAPRRRGRTPEDVESAGLSARVVRRPRAPPSD